MLFSCGTSYNTKAKVIINSPQDGEVISPDEVQIIEMQTGKRDEEKLNQIQEMYKELIEFEEIRKYFDAELKFNVLLGDVNKIISEAVKDIFMD